MKNIIHKKERNTTFKSFMNNYAKTKHYKIHVLLNKINLKQSFVPT